MRSLSLAVAASAALIMAGCSDRSDDATQSPEAGASPAPPAEAQHADQAVLAMGMTRQQLEDADLVSRANVELGEVDTVVLDPSGALTHLVIELEGPGAVKVVAPVADVAPIDRNGDRDLVTDLTLAQLHALPAWTPRAP